MCLSSCRTQQELFRDASTLSFISLVLWMSTVDYQQGMSFRAALKGTNLRGQRTIGGGFLWAHVVFHVFLRKSNENSHFPNPLFRKAQMSTTSFVHKIAFPPIPGKSVNFEDFQLICTVLPHFQSFSGGGGVKPTFADKNFMDTHPNFLIFYHGKRENLLPW